jgi:peptide/nickel transport system permease protein
VVLLGLNLLLVLVGPLVAPYGPTEFHTIHAFEGPSAGFPFGTDEFGRDVFSRILHGARPTLVLAAASTVLGVTLGAALGLVSGYYGGRIDEVLMRLMDGFMSFPALILAMLIITMLGPHAINVVLAIAVVFLPRAARVVRSVALQIGTLEFVDAARVRGESDAYIIFREMLPNAWNVIIVELSIRLSYAILLAASLAFLGVGYQPPSPAWGLMVKEGRDYIQMAPWLIIFPSLAVASASVGAVLLGDSVKQLMAIRGGGEV